MQLLCAWLAVSAAFLWPAQLHPAAAWVAGLLCCSLPAQRLLVGPAVDPPLPGCTAACTAEFSGMEAEIPTCWIPRDSDRIWRGSYKGKVRTEGGSKQSSWPAGWPCCCCAAAACSNSRRLPAQLHAAAAPC